MPRYSLYYSGQQGAALIMSLIMLTALSLLGIAAMYNATLQSRIAANYYDQRLALSAAELALRSAEVYLQTPPLPPWEEFDPILHSGLHPMVDVGEKEAWQQAANWGIDGNGSVAVTTPNGLYAQAPRFMIQQLSEYDNSPNLGSAEIIRMVRVTAKGIGSSDDTEAYLQADYRWK